MSPKLLSATPNTFSPTNTTKPVSSSVDSPAKKPEPINLVPISETEQKLRELFKLYYLNKDKNSIVPKDFVDVICREKLDLNKKNQQEDGSEFLLLLLNKLNSIRNKQVNVTSDNIEYNDVLRRIKDKLEYFHYLDYLFGIIQNETTICKDGSGIETTFNLINTVQLNCDQLKDTDITTIEKIYEMNMSNADVSIKRCPENEAYQKTKYIPVGKYVIIILKLFTYSTTGMMTKLNFKLTDITSPLIIENEQYNLIGFNSHQGSTLQKGHYVNYLKHDDKWKKYSDSDVMDVDDINNINNDTPYILIYEKNDDNFLMKEIDDKNKQLFDNFDQAKKMVNNNIRGLENLKNTCFMNSVMQLLLHNPGLYIYFQPTSQKGGGQLYSKYHHKHLKYKQKYELLMKQLSNYS